MKTPTLKKIIIPKEVPILKAKDGDIEYTFSSWVDDIINSTPEFGKGVKNLRQANELSRIVDDADKSDKEFLLEGEHYKMLSKATLSSLNVIFGRKAEAAGYYDAVENAEDYIPEIPAPKEIDGGGPKQIEPPKE